MPENPRAGDLRLEFDPALPISAAVDEIRALIAAHQVVVVAGETGSGKTTQLPKIALLAGRSRIAHTQPRRLAARTVATRIAQEMGVEIGDAVGYQVRFTRQATRRTKVKLMTDGILLAEIGHDRDLRHYDTIIIDEAHERSLNIDFLLGYLKQLLPRRPDLKVIITSATIDTARFAEHFGDAPIVEVSGRTYPVEIVYEPLEHENDLVDGIARAVTQLHALGEGDILVFCSGERDIRDAADAIEALKLRNTEVLPLFARLSAAEQDRVFRPHPGTMRVVLATNVAETSLTVPGIRYVVDPGFARMSRYSARTKVQRLPIEPVSQASANQRAGRCGRLGPGIAIRLYSEDDFLARPAFTEPEILRTNLASVILQMADARLGAIEDFPFVEPPDRSQVRDGLRLLKELGALQEERASKGREHKPSAEGPRLTKTGRLLVRLPIDPRLGRMLVEAGRRGAAWDVLPIVAALAIPDVRERPSEKQAEADALHRRFWSEDGAAHAAAGEAHGDRDPSDIAAIWRLWDYLRSQRNELSGNAFRRMCRDEFLNFLRIREWQDLVSQLREVVGELDLDTNAPDRDADHRRRRAKEPRTASGHTPDWDAVHTAVLSGLLSHVGLRDERSTAPRTQQRRGRRPMAEYLGARGARFAIQPGSAAAKAEPPLVMAVELVETSRLWARTVAPVTAEQVEEVGTHLITRQYSEPRWSVSGGQCVADERVSLLGVPIVAGRTVSYGRIDPVVARQMFIQSALVEGQWRTRHHFYARNEKVRAEAEELEERTRRRDIVVDDAAIHAFYDERIPAEITSVAHFDRWWRDKRRVEDDYLDLAMADLVDDTDAVDADAFPDTWTVGPTDLPVSYVFAPGAHRDGVSVDVDVSVLNQVDPAPFTWQVPGLRDELATELIRSLPKAVRTRFVPAPDWGRRALTWLDDYPDRASLAFPDALAAALGALSGEPLDATLFNESALPDHLTVRYVITDGRRELGAGKDFESLRKQFAPRLNKRLNAAASDVAHPGAKKWEFGTIPATREVDRDPTPLVGYPALVDQGETVGVRIANTAAKASRWQARGLRRLVMLESPDPTRSVFIHLSNADKIALSGGPYANLNALLADVRLKATGDLIAQHRVDPDTIRDEASFRRLVDMVRPDAAERMQAITRVAARILTRHPEVRAELARRPEGETRDDITAQLDNLVFDGFIAATPEPHFTRLDKYLHAVDVRLKGWTANPARELQNLSVIAELEDAYAAAVAVHEVGELPAAAVEAGWLLEELRVSLFAQSLGTAQPVSAKRVRGVLAALS
ncbi:ATP-dependent RNA helicase HrpA [Propioniciclava sinopodophylli]|uniref:ATP-dependent RNA helicase HrpA n=1 Tax=Propioniciclava sinopodophylli TaxID=1837344 RepID=UPI002492FE0F|nr:ATP-dependent RNA helicase HrpA [Propioniciclava sinopodophylli]